MRGYICCPLSGDIEGNIKKAIAYAKFVYDRCEMLPIVPHLMALVLDDNDPAQRALGISLGITQLLTATDIWIFGEQRSSGKRVIMIGRLNHIYKADLSHRAVSVYIYLYDRANKDGECWPSRLTKLLLIKISSQLTELLKFDINYLWVYLNRWDD